MLPRWIKQAQARARRIDHLSGISLCSVGLAVYVFVGLRPLLDHHCIPSGELGIQLQLVRSAALDIARGDIAIKYTPDIYPYLIPVFEYYNFLFYFVGGIISLFTRDTCEAILICIVIFLAVGVHGMYAAGRALGAREVPAALGALMLFVTPYLTTDLYVRMALAELCFWCVFPWMIAASIHFTQVPNWISALQLLFACVLVLLSHKIFLGWALIILATSVPFVCNIKRVVLLAPAYAMIAGSALLIVEPYVLEALANSPNLQIANGDMSFSFLTSGWKAFAFYASKDPYLDGYDYFSLHIEYTGLLGICIIAVGFWRSLPLRALVLPLLTSLFVLTSAMGATETLDYIVPFMLRIIQFPYRMLVFVSILTSLAISLFLSGRTWEKTRLALVLAVAVAQIFVFSFIPAPFVVDPDEEIAQGRVARGRDLSLIYAEKPPLPAYDIKEDLSLDPSVMVVKRNRAWTDINAVKDEVVGLPIAYSRHLDVLVNGRQQQALAKQDSLAGSLTMIRIAQGMNHVELIREQAVSFDRTPWIVVCIGCLALILPASRRACERYAPATRG